MIREKKNKKQQKKEEFIKRFREKDTYQFWKAVHRQLKGEAYSTCSFEPEQWEQYLKTQSVNGNRLEEDL